MTDELLSALVHGGVLIEADADGELAFGDGFLDNVADQTERVERGEWQEAFTEGVTQAESFSDTFAAVADREPELLGTYWALDDALDDLTFAELLQLLIVVDRFRYPPSEAAGTPEGFLAVRGDRLPALVEFIRHGIVYVWREDCDPCDVMVEQFDALGDGAEDAICLSVYGPPWASELYDSFEVAGAPTTLFISNGRVDSRLMGAYESQLIATELETAKSANPVSHD